jgi:hypothetical protein
MLSIKAITILQLLANNMLLRRANTFLAVLIILSYPPKSAIADTATLSGTCSIIIQGSNNTVSNAACNPSTTPGATVVRSKYMPVDLQDPAHPSLLHPTVIRENYGSLQKLTILLVYPMTQSDGNYFPPANLIMIYAYQTTASGRYDPPPGTFPTFSGSWGPGAQAKVELNVPTSYFEETSGWNMRLCIGTRERCVMSPNLLDGSRVLN